MIVNLTPCYVHTVRTLVEEMKDAVDETKQQEMGERLSKGVFTLRDMYEQFQSVMKLGPLNKVMGMIPGIPPWMAQSAGGQDGDNRIKGTVCCFVHLRAYITVFQCLCT